MAGGEKLSAYLSDALKKLTTAGKINVGFLDAERASIAFWNEFGTEHIPPRPFMRQTVAESGKDWGNDLGDILKANDMDAGKALDAMGNVMKSDIQQTMRDFTDPPNAKSTVAGKGFDNPLIGPTQDLIKSVDYEVE